VILLEKTRVINHSFPVKIKNNKGEQLFRKRSSGKRNISDQK